MNDLILTSIGVFTQLWLSGMWELFVEVTAVLQTAEGSLKRQWLIDVLEIGCITKHPSTVCQLSFELIIFPDFYCCVCRTCNYS